MIRRCGHRLPWNPDHRCGRAGWVVGLCVEHALEWFRFDHDGKWTHITVDLGMVNRPYVMVDEDRPRRWVALSWGNVGSDPVWSVIIGRKGQR